MLLSVYHWIKGLFARREAQMEQIKPIMVRDIIRVKQPEVYRELEREYGPFMDFDEYERMMQEKPRERVG